MRSSSLAAALTAYLLAQPETPLPRQSLDSQQLDNLVAPIALYPDPLLSQLLVASTYPLELVKALQWTQQHPNLAGAELTQAAGLEDWDPSVQALVLFPDLLKRLNQDIAWTTNLGGWRYPRFSAGIYFGFGLGVHMDSYLDNAWNGWGSWGWRPAWRQRNIVINNSFVYRHSFNSNRGESTSGSRNWTHDASHRQGVPYSRPGLTERYNGGVRRNLEPRMSQPIDRQPPSGGNRSVFGGIHEGAAARKQSDHGYSTVGPARSRPREGGAAPKQERRKP